MEKAKESAQLLVRNRHVEGFADFLREQSVVGLAIGLVLGTQVKQVVDSMVLNFFNPLIGLFLPGKGALDVKTFTLHFDGKTATFGYGAFVMVLLNFVLVAALVYVVFKMLKLDRLAKKKEADAKTADKEKKDKKKTTRKTAKQAARTEVKTTKSTKSAKTTKTAKTSKATKKK